MIQVVPDYIPSAFGVAILTLSLILTLSPYFSGHDFGIFKIPTFGNVARKRMKIIGPLFFIIAILLHVPLGPKVCTEPVFQTVTDAKLCGTVKEEYVVTPETFKTCRHPDFGRTKWSNTKTINQSSDWVRGGSNPTNHCNNVLSSFLKTRGIGGDYSHKILSKSQESRNRPWDHAYYNYHCSIEVNWGSIYNEKKDAKCGIIPAVLATREVAAECEKEIGTKRVPCEG